MTTRVRLQATVSAVAIVAITIHHLLPSFRADAFTGTFLLVAVLPWLAPLLKSVKLPGGFEVELRELREELEETKGAVKSAAIQAQVGAASTTVTSSPSVSEPIGRRHPSAADLVALGGEYERVRNSMRASDVRTEAMTRVVAEMLKVAAHIANFDVRALVASKSRGERLAAIAYTHEHPSPSLAEPLARALTDTEDTPFGQYWALRALRRIAANGREAFFPELCERLALYKTRQKPGTDRHYEATQLMREAGCRSAPADDPYGF